MSSRQQAVDLNTLKGLQPVAALSAKRIQELAEKTFIETLEPEVMLFREGEMDRQLVYLLDGQIELRSGFNDTPRLITAGMPETWHPLANQQPRKLSAVALSHVEVIRINIDEFDRMMAWDQMAAAEAGAGDSQDQGKLTIRTGWTGKMKQSSAFQNLPPANIEELFRRMETIEVKAGDTIIRQGDPGDYYYLIDAGIARVVRQMSPGAAPVELAQLPEGASFGEEALLSDNPRNATVIMASDGRLKRLAKQDFVELLQEPMLNWMALDQAIDKLGDQTKFLDVRVASEYQQGHLPNAINIPLFELRQREDELDSAVHYICYCSTGRRSSAGSFILAQHGFKASVLKDGMLGVPPSFVIKQAP